MYVCKDCFADEELRSEVHNSTITGICTMCQKAGKVLDFKELYDFFNELLLLFEPSNSSTKTIVDIIQDEWNIFANGDIAEVLLNDVINAHHYVYSISTFVDYSKEIKNRVAVWDRIKESVKEKSRFFTSIDEIIQYGYLTAGGSLHKGQKLYRSRVTPKGQKKIKYKEMGCPPKESASAGRANPLGIPYLYLCNSAKTTYFEVRAVHLDKLSVGTFEVQQDLKLVDFIYDVNLYLAYSDGSASLKETIIKKKVIEAISADLSKPLRRYDTELEYVPTQLICEYCKSIANGISFVSSLYKDGRNYVLFDPSMAKCMRVDSHEIVTIDIDRK